MGSTTAASRSSAGDRSRSTGEGRRSGGIEVGASDPDDHPGSGDRPGDGVDPRERERGLGACTSRFRSATVSVTGYRSCAGSPSTAPMRTSGSSERTQGDDQPGRVASFSIDPAPFHGPPPRGLRTSSEHAIRDHLRARPSSPAVGADRDRVRSIEGHEVPRSHVLLEALDAVDLPHLPSRGIGHATPQLLQAAHEEDRDERAPRSVTSRSRAAATASS